MELSSTHPIKHYSDLQEISQKIDNLPAHASPDEVGKVLQAVLQTSQQKNVDLAGFALGEIRAKFPSKDAANIDVNHAIRSFTQTYEDWLKDHASLVNTGNSEHDAFAGHLQTQVEKLPHRSGPEQVNPLLKEALIISERTGHDFVALTTDALRAREFDNKAGIYKITYDFLQDYKSWIDDLKPITPGQTAQEAASGPTKVDAGSVQPDISALVGKVGGILG